MNYRVDIQALRGVAVLAVVFYHARLLPLQGGYLGVDIFFVISGFLITSQIARQLSAEKFSFKAFYLRRAWRLLPAAYVVFFLCLILSPWILNSIEFFDFKEQVFGAITFTANIILWNQTGYFETAAEFKPLLHTWSLSIEEQYYLIMPALLFLISRNQWLIVVLLLTIASFILMSALVTEMPGATFYLTPTRVWELGIGSVLALSIRQYEWQAPAWMGYISLGVLFILLIRLLPVGEHLEINLLVITVATALVISAQLPLLQQGFIARNLANAGTISYSLYLVHWPILAFLNNINISATGLWWPYRMGAVILSIAMAWILYACVESRLRIKRSNTNKTFLPLIIASLFLLLTTYFLSMPATDIDYKHERRVNTGLSLRCSELNYDQLEECKTSSQPSSIVWGDSFAMHLLPGLKLNTDNGFQQATRSSCAPLTTIGLYTPPKYGESWAQECLTFNQKVLDDILASKTLKLIIMASAWNYLLNDHNYLIKSNDKTHLARINNKKIADALERQIKLIRDRGKQVVIVAPPPSTGFDIGKCHERLATNKWRIEGTKDCSFDTKTYQIKSKKIQALMDELKDRGIPIYSFSDNLCNDTNCRTKVDDVVLYRDSGHLSHAGSELYATKFKLLNDLRKLAASQQTVE